MREKTQIIIEKIFLAVCVTVLAMIVLFFSFGGCCIMGKGIRFWVAVATGVIFLVSVFICLFYCDDNDCKKFCHEYHCPCLKSAKEINSMYWIDKCNESKLVPNDKTIIIVKGNADINKVQFSEPNKVEMIFLDVPKIKISTEKLNELKNAKIYLGEEHHEIVISKE